MSIDLNQNETKVTPAIEAKEFPLAYMRLMHVQASSPQSIRLYAEMCPYRRITDEKGAVIGEEFKSPEVDGDITVIEVPNVVPMVAGTPEADALLAQTIGQYMAAGGNIMAMAFTAILLAVKGYGEATGKLKAD